jgi:hypothetical protein
MSLTSGSQTDAHTFALVRLARIIHWNFGLTPGTRFGVARCRDRLRSWSGETGVNILRPGLPHFVVIAPVAVCACWVSISAAPQTSDLDALMTRIGERVASYYRQAQRVICIESSTVQPIGSNRAPEGFARTVESELRVESEPADGSALPAANVIRDVRRINGRAPRERDKKARSGCTDPNPLSPEPLAFLLPARRGEYRFATVRGGKEKGRAALVIDFVSMNRESRPELIEDERGHDDCFDWSGPIATSGRIWVDPNTYDVLRVDRRLDGPVDVRVPWTLQRRYSFGPWVVLERDDLTMHYKAVAFSDPDEVIRLPESIESMTVLHGGLQSIRRTDTFSGYRRFLGTGRVVKEP